jgi:DNA-binding MarR family transcriptional regulator
MPHNAVDRMAEDWRRERPEIDTSSLEVTTRITLLRKVLAREDKKALAPLAISPWACDVVLALRRQGPPYQLTPTGLRQMTLLTSGAMTTRLDRLVETALVIRTPDPDDRRSFQIALTMKGLDLAERAITVRAEMAARLLAPLTVDEREVVSSLLGRVLAPVSPA